MNIHQFINLIGKKKQTILSVLIIFVAAAIIFSAVQPFKYDSNIKLLTIISFQSNVDPYTASRSNEYLSNLLADIVSSGSFFDKIKSSGFNINTNYFSGTEKQQMKKWAKTVKAKSVADTGMINVDVYHTDRAQAEEIAKAVAYTLQTTNSQYHGFGDGVQIKIIDNPITSDYPVQPNLLLNLGLAIAFTLIFSFCYIYVFPEEKYDIRLWPKKSSYAKATEDESAHAKATEDESAFAKVSSYAEAAEGESSLTPAFAEIDEDETGAYPQKNNFGGYDPSDYQANGNINNIWQR
ncbi:MAG TPA: hypothetical protein VMC41_00070 [Candidatus Nanoarchaeia archaeon]|nr:hypothetical protein [Candidatus Nanoarchaeia archaeon]